MGTEVPETWPEIDPDLWYICTVQRYAGVPPATNCQHYINTQVICRLGSEIIDYIENDRQCTNDPLGGPPLVSTDRLIAIGAAFVTKAACQLEL